MRPEQHTRYTKPVNPAIQPLTSWWPHARRDELHIDTVLAADLDHFCRNAAKAGRKIVHIKTHTSDQHDIYTQIQKALGLPESVTNLDALWDVLTDDNFRPTARHVLVFDTCLDTTNSTDLKKILEVVAEARDTPQPPAPATATYAAHTPAATFDVVTTVGRNHA